jgi:hypothetical protein
MEIIDHPYLRPHLGAERLKELRENEDVLSVEECAIPHILAKARLL